MSGRERVLRAFVEAFNEQNLERLASLVDPAVEIHARRGVVVGREGARDWARSSPDGSLDQRLVIDSLLEAGDEVLVDARRQWHWREGIEHGGADALADEAPLAILVSFTAEPAQRERHDGRLPLIRAWRPFDDRDEALALLGSAARAPNPARLDEESVI